MIAKPNAIAISHSVKPNSVSLNSEATAGTSHTIVVSANETNTEASNTQFCFLSVKMDWRRLRRFMEWKQPTIHIVRKAMLIPCGEVAISHVPVSI